MTAGLISAELYDRLKRMLDAWEAEYDPRIGRQRVTRRMPHDYSIRVGKVDADVSADESVSVSIYHGTTKGSETDTGENVTAYLRYSSLSAGAWCHVAYIDGGWEILVGDPCWEP